MEISTTTAASPTPMPTPSGTLLVEEFAAALVPAAPVEDEVELETDVPDLVVDDFVTPVLRLARLGAADTVGKSDLRRRGDQRRHPRA